MQSFSNSWAHHRCIIVAVDFLTRYTDIRDLVCSTAEMVSDFFRYQILLRHGAPQFVIGNLGTPFMSKRFQELVSCSSTIENFTTTYPSHAGGQTERVDHILLTMIYSYVNENYSDRVCIVAYVTFACITARQGTTEYSPYHLLYACDRSTALGTVLPFRENCSSASYIEYVLYRAENARPLLGFPLAGSSAIMSRQTPHGGCLRRGREIHLWTPARQPA